MSATDSWAVRHGSLSASRARGVRRYRRQSRARDGAGRGIGGQGNAVTAALVASRSPMPWSSPPAPHPYPGWMALDGAHVVTRMGCAGGEANVGASVAIADWRADWIGLGLAEHLATAGCAVTLCVNAAMAGRDTADVHAQPLCRPAAQDGCASQTHARLFGADDDSVYFQDTLSEEPIVLEGIDTLGAGAGPPGRGRAWRGSLRA